ncbi:MAG TPA: DMT family transporter [Candidatus Limnocylindrales bacterium]
MDAFVFVLVAGAAVLHATWNVLLKTAGDPLRAATIGMLAGGAVLIPGATVGWFLIGRPPFPVEALVLGVGSGVLEAVYFIFLSAAYRRGDLSVVYPIARGTGVFLAVILGVTVLGERPGILGWAGIVALLIGLLALQRPWRSLRRRSGDGLDPAVGFALLTGVTIASYSTVDRTGARLIEPWLYAALLWATTAVVLVAWRAARGNATDDPLNLPRAVLGGLLTLAAYLLVLVAFRLAPLTAVAPLRESAIVLASGWGAFRLGEASGRRAIAVRLGAAAVIAVGAALLALDR